MKKTIPMLALAALAIAAGPGCHGIEPVVELTEDDRFVLLPLAERRLGHFESAIGAQITDVAIESIEREIGDYTEVVGSDELYALFDDKNIDLNDTTPLKIAEHIGANVYAVGRIREWRMQDPGAINMFHGVCEIDLEIYRRSDKEGKKPKLEWKGQVRAEFPDEYGNDFGLIMVGNQEEDVRRGLILLAGRNLGRKFYEWEPPAPGDD